MLIKNNFTKVLLLIILSLSVVSCSSDAYDRGYEKGYYKGYNKGKEEGLSEGYREGTMDYVSGNALPSLGNAIVLILFMSAIYFSYKYLKDPSKRAIDDATDLIEKKRQERIAEKELIRKKYSIEEQAKIKAHNLANKVFEKTIQAITDEKSRSIIEQLKQKAEEKILSIQLEEVAKIADEYQKSIEELKEAKNLSSNEKSELFKEIREIFGEI